MRRVHLDTDFGGDPDDACALALLLGWPDVEVVGITTNLAAGGGRAALAKYFPQPARRSDIPVVAGAAESMTRQRRFESTWADPRYWPAAVASRPAESLATELHPADADADAVEPHAAAPDALQPRRNKRDPIQPHPAHP